jgi:thymidylate synthase ThyX
LNEDHFTKTHANAHKYSFGLFEKYGELDTGSTELSKQGDVKLVDWTENADMTTLRAILHSHTQRPVEDCAALVEKLIKNGEADAFIRETLKFSNPWESATREFEAADFTFEAILSAACYGQMKRHRMSTQLVQGYDPGLGYTYPPSVVETGLKPDFEALYKHTDEVYQELTKYDHVAAQYVLTNGHRRRMLVKANARELYHISRLREDAHAQWDIRNVSGDMLALAREKAPLTLMLAWGKDKFNEKKNEIYGN